MKRIVLCFILLLLIKMNYAQDSSFQKKIETFIIQNDGSNYLLNNKIITTKDFKELLLSNTHSSAFYTLFKKKFTTAKILSTSALLLSIIAITQKNNNETLSAGLAIAGLSTTIISLPIIKGSRMNFKKAIYFYNKSIL